MKQISKLPVYAGTIPNKATQSDDEFANNIFGFLNYSGNSFVRDFNVIVDEFNTLSDEIQTAEQSISNYAGQAKTARDEALGALATLTAGAIDNTNKANNKAYSNIKVDELLDALDLSDISETTTLKHFTATLLTKLNGIAANANNYSHPDAHDASMITESTTKRFVSDEEKASWNAKLDASSGVPIGTVIDFASPTAPAGYLKCNGALISRSAYSALFSVIGTTYGEGDGSTTFALPDRRGLFSRGWDDGRGIDVVNIASWSYSGSTITINTTDNHCVTVGQKVTISGLGSTTNAPNGTFTVASIININTFTFIANATPTGTATVSNAKITRPFGSYQDDAIQEHRHAGGTDGTSTESPSSKYTLTNKTINGVTYGTSAQSGGGGYNTNTTSRALPESLTGTIRTAQETRSKNIATNYCIKY